MRRPRDVSGHELAQALQVLGYTVTRPCFHSCYGHEQLWGLLPKWTTLLSDFHNQVSQPFSLSQANTGELQAELPTIDPANKGLIDAERPFKIIKKQRQFEEHSDLHFDR